MTFTWDRPAIASSPISAILPAYQGEKTLPTLLPALLAELDKLQRDYEVLVVDDGSTDQTRGVAQEFGKQNSRVQCLHHEARRGYGAALRTGLAAAKHPLLLTVPADGSYRPDDLPKLLAVIDQVDVVCGVRRPRPWLKTQLQGWLAFFAFGLWFKDVACHFRLYRRSIFHPRIPIQSKTCFADVEILAKANFLGCLGTEVEVAWLPVPELAGPSSVFRDALRVFSHPDFGPAKVDAATK